MNDKLMIVLTRRNNKLMICADRYDCFDKKWSCPIQLPFPKTAKQTAFLKTKLKWLSSKAAYKISNEYLFNKFIKTYPK